MKKCLTVWLLLLLLLGTVFAAPALALPETIEDSVVDAAGVLSAAVHNDVNNLGTLMREEIGAEIIVVAVAYITDGQDAEQMAFALADQWQVSPRGMLLLFSTQERRCWLAIGEEIVGNWPVNRVDAYLTNYFYDELDAGNFDAAVIGLFHALALWYENYYGVRLVSEAEQPLQGAPALGGGADGIAAIFRVLLPILLLVVGVIVVISLLSRRRPRGPMGPMGGRRRGSWFMPMMIGWGLGRRRGLGNGAGVVAHERRALRWA